MITEILTTEKPVNQKPRFFLHDEVKAWLKDNIHLSLHIDKPSNLYIPSIANMDQDYYNRYDENVPISTYIRITSQIFCDGDQLGFTEARHIDLSYEAKLFESTSKRLKESEKNIVNLLKNQMTMQEEIIKLRQELIELKQK